MFKKPSSGKRSSDLSQFGLLDVGMEDEGDDDMGMSDNDFDLEAELAEITGESKKPKPRKKPPVPGGNLDAMIAESLRDIPSDEEDVSGDEDDPALLDELKEMGIDDDEEPAPPPRASRPAPAPPSSFSTQSSTVSLLQDRILNYTAAEKQAAEAGESSRARRFHRGLGTLNDLLRKAKAGKDIDESEIPPPAVLKSAQPSTPSEPPSAPPVPPRTPEESPAAEELPSLPEPSEPPPPPPAEEMDPAKKEGLQMILRRQQEFKVAALSCKQSGDKAMALEYLKVAKQFDLVVQAYKEGQEMDLNELPTPSSIAEALKSEPKAEEHTQKSAEPEPAPAASDGGLIMATTMDEALKQRLAAFQKQEAKAKEDGNGSKARRMGRIVQQYKDAIRQHAAGKPVAADDLPAPAGYGPLPTEGGSHPSAAPAAAPRAAPRPAPAAPAAPAAPSRHDKQLAFLLLRQKEFKEAAINAKKRGDIEQARDYLRAMKGFDSVIDAARGGLVVDLKSLPLPPRAKEKIEQTFDVVSTEDCTPEHVASPLATDDADDVLTKLSQQLTNQLKLCLTNRDHYREMGNVAEMNRFEHLAVRVKQDLDVVVVAKSLNNPPPKFHYESRQFSVVQCNTDLNENDLELTIVRGISYNVPNPKDVDTYVKFEYPFPQDAPVSDRTSLVKDTNSPVYNAVFNLSFQRGARPTLRLFKRHAIKMEVYSRGGWFSRDTLLGTAAARLAPLETAVALHEAFPLMEGRRAAGGSLEVKLRVRTPIVQQQMENTTHRWLIIDN